MPTAVVSGRVDEGIRQKADVVMRKAGLKPTEIIQNVWTAMATTGEVPEAAKPASEDSKERDALAQLDRFLKSLPGPNPALAGLSDDDILAMKVRDNA